MCHLSGRILDRDLPQLYVSRGEGKGERPWMRRPRMMNLSSFALRSDLALFAFFPQPACIALKGT